MKWYNLLASVSGARMTMETTRRRARRISAFWEGGRGGELREKVFKRSRQHASANRMGKIVKVYMNESRQTINPKRNIYNDDRFNARKATVMLQTRPTFSRAMGMLRKLLTRSHLSS